MTLKEFFRKARRGRQWRTDEMNQVRCADEMCPLGAVAKLPSPFYPDRFWGMPNPVDAAKKVGLRVRIARRIARAADWPNADRPWLLKNLGIRA